MKTTVIVIIFIVCIAGAYIYQKWAQKQFLNKLYVIRATGKKEDYLAALDTNYAKFVLSDSTRIQMKLKYCIQNDQIEEIQKIMDSLADQKLSKGEKAQAYFQLFGYYVQKEEIKEAEQCKQILDTLLEKTDTKEQELIKGEAEQIEQIYIKKNVDLIPDLEETLVDMQNKQVKAVLCSRLAYLYKQAGMEEKAATYAQQVKEMSEAKDND